MNKRHQFTRRDFLKTSIASLTTLAIVPRYVLGGPGFTPPSEVLTRAVIGTGGMGMNHVTGINTACKLLAVCDVDEKHLQNAIKAGGPDVKGYKDFREVLARKDIDIVHIPTPPHWHALISIAAAKAGKDIWCEKPMTRTIAEGEAVKAAVARYKRIFRLNTWFRFDSPFYGMGVSVKPIKKLVQAGVFGWPLKITLDGKTGFDWKQNQWCGRTDLIPQPVPLGSGLSSSAALEVATATLLEAISGKKLDPVQKALLCQRAEHEFAGVPCGIMDQFISTMGQKDNLLLIDCRAQQGELVPFDNPELALLIINTNVRHSLADGEYGKRRAQCEAAAKALNVRALRDAALTDLEAARSQLDPLIFRRARHVISENARTVEAAKCLRAGQWERVGQLMYASHDSLRDDYEVSCEELDWVVERAKKIGPAGGVLGCRMTGGGFGGCAVALVKAENAKPISREIGEGYLARTRTHASVFVSRPGPGASLLERHSSAP